MPKGISIWPKREQKDSKQTLLFDTKELIYCGKHVADYKEYIRNKEQKSRSKVRKIHDTTALQG